MAEILTESFCERCGTRYTFESAARRTTPLGMLGTVGRGIRNFVAMPDASLDEAFAVARAETEQGATAHQLEAFHRTFNFCLSCRQYTCADCWNAVEGRCLSCSPLPEAETRADATEAAESFAIATSLVDAPAPGIGPSDLPWPTIELHDHGEPAHVHEHVEAIAEPALVDLDDVLVVGAEPVAAEPEAPAAWPEEISLPEAVAERDEVLAEEDEEAEPHADDLEAEPAALAEALESAEPEAPPTQPATPLSSIGPARRGPASLPAFEPGVSLDEQIAAYDLRIAALQAEPEAPAPDLFVPAATVPPFAPPPVAPVPVAPPTAAPPIAAVAPSVARPAAPQPQPQAAARPAAAAQSAGIPDIPVTPDASTMAAGAVGTCPSCGLSLSASARFCRRCGTQQRA